MDLGLFAICLRVTNLMCKTGLDTDVMILITALYVYYDMSVSPRVMFKKKREDFDTQQSFTAVVQSYEFFYDECRRAGGTERRNCCSLVA